MKIKSLTPFLVIFLSCSSSVNEMSDNVGVIFNKYVNDTVYLKSILNPILHSGDSIASIGYYNYQDKYLSFWIKNNLQESIFLLGKSFFEYPIDTLSTTSISIIKTSDDGKNFIELKKNRFEIKENFDGFDFEIPPNEVRERLIFFDEKNRYKFYMVNLVYGIKTKKDSIVLYNENFIISTSFAGKF